MSSIKLDQSKAMSLKGQTGHQSNIEMKTSFEIG